MTDDSNDDLELQPSKSQRKRDMAALQALGETLAALPAARLQRCQLPETLLQGIADFQGLPNKHGARRRQLQYIGKLMRTLDEDQLAQIQRVLSRQ